MTEKTIKNNNIKDLRDKAGGSMQKPQIRLKSLGDVRRFLARTTNDLAAGICNESRTQTLGYLCSILRDVVRDSELENRVKNRMG